MHLPARSIQESTAWPYCGVDPEKRVPPMIVMAHLTDQGTLYAPLDEICTRPGTKPTRPSDTVIKQPCNTVTAVSLNHHRAGMNASLALSVQHTPGIRKGQSTRRVGRLSSLGVKLAGMNATTGDGAVTQFIISFLRVPRGSCGTVGSMLVTLCTTSPTKARQKQQKSRLRTQKGRP